MKKIVLAAIAALGLVSTSNAQMEIKFGPKVGVNLASLSDLEEGSMRTAYNVGGVLEFKLSDRFSIQPELMYSAQGAKGEKTILGVKTSYAVQNDYVTVPVLAKVYLVEGVSLEVGPQVGFLVNSKFVGKVGNIEKDTDIKKLFGTTDFSVAFGAAYDFPQGLFINARYNLGLNKITEDATAENITFKDRDLKNSVIQIGAGYKF